MPSLGLGLGLDKSQGLILAPEAVSWAAAVVAAGSSVPASVVFAVSEFVKECQADASPNAGVNNWTAMKSVQLLAGPATFAGISAPLKGVAPTFFNFVGGDYNPATGLLGDGSTKYINTGRNNNADPQNNSGAWCWVTAVNDTSAIRYYIGSIPTAGGLTRILTNQTTGDIFTRVNDTSSNELAGSGGATGFLGVSRAVSGSYTRRVGGSNSTVTQASSTAGAGNLVIFGNGTLSSNFGNGRIAAYGIGEAVDLTALDARLTTLMAAIAAAHP